MVCVVNFWRRFVTYNRFQNNHFTTFLFSRAKIHISKIDETIIKNKIYSTRNVFSKSFMQVNFI